MPELTLVSDVARADWPPAFRRDLHAPPALPPGLVPRPRLLAHLKRAETPLVVLVAPPGYGKTAAVVEWSRADDRRFLWLTLDVDDNDPEQLVGRIGHVLQHALSSSDAAPSSRVSLAASPNERRPFVLVLDNVRVLHVPGAVDALKNLIERMPRWSQLVLIARRTPKLPLGRLRAQRAVTEVEPRDLALTPVEAAALLQACGIVLPRDKHQLLMSRTEGWPAATYLAAMAIRDLPDPAAGILGFRGDDARVAAYLREEVLDDLTAAEREFLVRASVLDRLSGPACDAVLGRNDSARVLAGIADANLLLVPVDPARSSYRWHPLLREMLTGELRRLHPEDEPLLHERACEWHIGRDDRDQAVAHAIAAGDVDHAADLVALSAAEYITHGHNGHLRRLLQSLDSVAIERNPKLAIAASLSHLASGDLAGARRLASSARCGLAHLAPANRAPEPGAGLAVLEAVVDGAPAARLRTAAARARRDAPAQSTRRSVFCLIEGLAAQLIGDRDAAEARLSEGARIAAIIAPGVHALCLAQLALLAAEVDDTEAAAVRASQAVGPVADHGLDSYPTSSLVFAVSAFVRSRRGRLEAARDDARAAARGLRALGEFVPWYGAETRVALARAMVRIGDVADARVCLEEAERQARTAEDTPVLSEWIEAARAEVDAAIAAVASGPVALTNAEIRVLNFLPTHLSFREIAGRLFVSANTVKTQAHSVYRKLEASSRSEAVVRATELGLVGEQMSADPV